MPYRLKLNHIRILVNLIPLIWMALIYSTTFYFKLRYGYVPIPSLNDSKNTINIVVLDSIYILFALSLVCFVTNIVLLFTDFFMGKLASKISVLIIANIFLIAIQLIYDPFQIIEWLLD